MSTFTNKLVALDIGNVCVSIHFAPFMQCFGIRDMLSIPAQFIKLDRQFEVGELSTEEWLNRFDELTAHRFTKARLLEIWNSIVGPSLPGMEDAIRRAVKRGWRFVFFSNTSKPHMDKFLSENEFCHLVTGAVFSYDAHALKPDAKIYEVFERDYGIPEFYFDDSATNIAAGSARGWNSVQFRSPDQLNELLYE